MKKLIDFFYDNECIGVNNIILPATFENMKIPKGSPLIGEEYVSLNINEFMGQHIKKYQNKHL